MSISPNLDRQLATWLATDHPADMDPMAVDAALARARRVAQRGSFLLAIVGPAAWPRRAAGPGLESVSPRVRLLVLAGLVVALLGLGILLAAARQPARLVHVPGPALPTAVASDVPAIGLADGRALFMGCSPVVVDVVGETVAATGRPTACHFRGTAARLLDGRVLVAGDGSADRSKVAEIYDPATNTFSRTGDLLQGLSGANATTLLDGRILISGGVVASGGSSFEPAISELYDPATGSFTATGSTLRPRPESTATLLLDGRVLVTGGGETHWSSGPILPGAIAEAWDPVTGAFSAVGSMTSGRIGGTATLLPDGRVLLAGGYWANAGTLTQVAGDPVLLETGDVFDPTTNTFSATAPIQLPRWEHVAILLPDGRVLLAGGRTALGSYAGPGIADAEVFEPGTSQFTTATPLLHPRMNGIAISLVGGWVLIAGHLNGNPLGSDSNPAGSLTEVFR